MDGVWQVLVRLANKEQLLATTTSDDKCDMINDAMHKVDPALTTELEGRIKVWGYLMMQYNHLKLGLSKFGERGTAAVVKELIQLHLMDTWRAINPTKLSREQWMQALLSLLFLNKKQIGDVKGHACINGLA